MKVFIDLESTIIDTWRDANWHIEGIKKIRKFLRENNIKEVFIFSYAVDNLKDQEDFDKRLKAPIEDILGVKVGCRPWSVEEFVKIAQKKISPSITTKIYKKEFFVFMKKDIFFPIFVKELSKWDGDTSFVLFDDMVENTAIIYDSYQIQMFKV